MPKKYAAQDIPLYPGAEKFDISGIIRIQPKVMHDKTSIIFGDKKITWGELNERSNAIANALIDLGVSRDENVAIMLRNCPEYMELYYACWKAVFMPANVNYRYVPSELHYVINDQEAAVLFLTDDLIDIVNQIRPKLKTVRHYIVIGEIAPSNMLSYNDLLNKYDKTEPKLPWKPLQPSDTLMNFYTGGTTGLPKGVLWRMDTWYGLLYGLMASGLIEEILPKIANGPKGMLENTAKSLGLPVPGGLIDNRFTRWVLQTPMTGRALTRILKWIIPISMAHARLFSIVFRFTGGRLKALIACPLIHGAGTAVAIMMCFFGATNIFLQAPSFSAKEVCETIERQRPAIIMCVGDAYYKPILEELEKKHYDTSSLMAMASVGVTWSPEVKKGLLKHIPNAMILDFLSATEAISPAIGVSLSTDEEIPYHVFDSVKADPKKG